MSNRKEANAREFFREYPVFVGMRSPIERPSKSPFTLIQNMYYNRESDSGGIESIPGYRKIFASEGKIHSMAIRQVEREKQIIFHSGSGLYRLKLKDSSCEKIGSLANAQSRIFLFDKLCLITDGQCLYSLAPEGELTPIEGKDIAYCSSATLFDGRLFLAVGGNIIYSEKLLGKDISFPEGNLTVIGSDILSLLSHGGRLWAFTASDIICLDSREGYPVYLSFSGVNPLGQAATLGSEIIFLSREGLLAIENPASRENIAIRNISEDILPHLCSESIAGAHLSVWQGYALICCGERILLCHRKRGESDCDWYILSGIGGHSGDRRVFRYSSEAEDGYSIHQKPDTRAEGEAISLKTEEGKTVYFVEEKGKKYAVYPTEERYGGSLLPAEITVSDGQLLAFSAEGGIYLFNNGGQGDGLSEHSKSYYSFDGHAPVYLIRTEYDSIGLPVGEKSSEGESLYLKIKAPRAIPLTVTVSTDKGVASIQRLTALPSEHNGCRILKVSERAHGWIEKQIEIEVSEYGSPFTLCSMAYKYRGNNN